MRKKVEVKQLAENEFQIENNKVFVINNNIVYIEVHGEQTDEIALAHFDHNKLLINTIKGTANYLINLNDAGKSSHFARKIWQEISELDTTEKIALFGMHPVAKILAGIVMGVTNKKEIRFFKKEKKAREWLKNDND